MPDGGIVTTFTDITAEREGGRGARARQRDAGAARAGAHRGADPAQHRAGARQGGGRAGQHLEDPLPGRREPRHPAAAQRRAPLRHQPGRAAGRRRGRPARRQHRRLARCGRGDLRRAARHFAARYRRHEAGDRQSSASTRCCASSRSSSRRWRSEQGPAARRSCPARWRCNPTAGCCGACCRTSSRTRSSTRPRAACWSAAAAAAGSCASTSTIPGSAFRRRSSRRSSRSSTASIRAPRWRAGLGLGLSIVERIARVLDHKVDGRLGRRPRLAVLGRGAAAPRRAAAPAASARRAAVDRVQLAGIAVLCIDNELAILDGMETLLGGWGCRVLKAPDLKTAIARDRRSQGCRPTACWSTITSTRATASRRSRSCAGASAPTSPPS